MVIVYFKTITLLLLSMPIIGAVPASSLFPPPTDIIALLEASQKSKKHHKSQQHSSDTKKVQRGTGIDITLLYHHHSVIGCNIDHNPCSISWSHGHGHNSWCCTSRLWSSVLYCFVLSMHILRTTMGSTLLNTIQGLYNYCIFVR